jgi:small subunit ribosomal protein S16
MALTIRLRQQGRTNRQTYRLVVTDTRVRRGGKYLEMLGWYNPFQADRNAQVKPERIQFWLGQGAQISDNVHALLARVAPDVVSQLHAQRQAKRTRAAAKRRALKAAKKTA